MALQGNDLPKVMHMRQSLFIDFWNGVLNEI